jgi:hypothetical protein
LFELTDRQTFGGLDTLATALKTHCLYCAWSLFQGQRSLVLFLEPKKRHTKKQEQ